MAGQNAGTIYYEIDVQTASVLRGQQAVNDSLDKAQAGFAKTDRAAKGLSDSLNTTGKSAGKADNSLREMDRGASSLLTRLNPLSAAIAGLFTAQALIGFQQAAEQTNLLAARITRLAGSAEQGKQTYQALLAIANQTGTDLPDTVKLWENLQQSLTALGATQSQILNLTSTLQKIGAVGGSSAEDMANALRQFGQSVSGGVVRAEEFNAVVENMPELARTIARGLGIPFDELRQRMLDGKLTATDALNAIQNQSAKVNQEFEKLPRTSEQAGKAIKNSFNDALASLDNLLGVSQKIATMFDRIGEATRLANGSLSDQDKLNQLLRDRADIVKEMGAWDPNASLTKGFYNKLKAQLEAKDAQIAAARSAAAGPAGGNATAPIVPTTRKTSPEDQKVLDNLKDQVALANLAGEARARLAAEQKLSSTASDAEKKAAGDLAVQIYQLTEAQKSNTKQTNAAAEAAKTATKQNDKSLQDLANRVTEVGLAGDALARAQAKVSLNEYATPEQIQRAQDLASAIYQGGEAAKNAEVIKRLGEELSVAGKRGLELAQAQALLKVNQYATPDQINQVKQLTAALYAQQQAEQNKQLLGQVDPVMGAAYDFQTQMDQYQQLNDAKLLSDQNYYALKSEAEQAFHDKVTQLNEERFRAQSVTNDLLIGSINKFGEASTNAITGLLSGTYNAQDAIRQLAQGILQEGVSALVQFGLQQVKNVIIGQSAAAAATAANLAQAAALSSAYAAPAALASLASFGANAAPANAALVGTMALAKSLGIAGGRQYGGPVGADGLYRVNENGAPEVFNAANGQQFMIPNQAGKVVSNKDATQQTGQAGGNVSINLYNDPSKAGTVNETRADDGSRMIDIFVADLMGDGKSARALQQAYGVKRQGQ